MTIKKTVLSILAIAPLAVVAACSDGGSNDTEANTTDETPSPVVSQNVTPNDGASPAANDTIETAPKAPAMAGKDFDKDVVGIRLGMSMDQAKEALKAHNPRMQVAEAKKPIVIRDSRHMNMNFGEYVSSLSAWWGVGVQGFGDDGNNNSDTITVIFSGPPSEQQVVLVERKLAYASGAGPTMATVTGALDNKYGPAAFSKEQFGVVQHIWYGEANAYTDSDNIGYAVFLDQSAKNTGLGLIRLRSDLPLPRNDPGPALKIVVAAPGQSVTSLSSILMDSLGGIAEFNLATHKMTQQLLEKHEAELREKASEQAAPSL